MGCVKLFSDNYADANVYANLLVSSEQANFPAENVLSTVRRSKVWRSEGYYLIESGSNTIVFRDVSGGGDKTATITAGEYTTTASFMAAVDAAFEAAGSANYTVTQDSTTLRFVITSDLSGGATHFELYWATSTAMASIMGFAASNLTGASTYTADYLRINTQEFLVFDLGLPSTPNGFAFCGSRNRAIKISTTATLKLQGNTTNSWATPGFEETLVYDDQMIYTLDPNYFSVTPYRYWRLLIQDQNPNGYVEIGSLFLGTHYSPTRGAAQFPFSTSLDDSSNISYSDGGQSFSNVLEKTATINLTWSALTKQEVEALMDIFEFYGNSYPLFVSFDSSEAFTTSVNRNLKLVKFVGKPSVDLTSPNNFRMSMQFREEI